MGRVPRAATQYLDTSVTSLLDHTWEHHLSHLNREKVRNLRCVVYNFPGHFKIGISK